MLEHNDYKNDCECHFCKCYAVMVHLGCESSVNDTTTTFCKLVNTVDHTDTAVVISATAKTVVSRRLGLSFQITLTNSQIRRWGVSEIVEHIEKRTAIFMEEYDGGN